MLWPLSLIPCRQQIGPKEKGCGMRGLIGLVLVLGVLWSGYWFVGGRGFERAANAWVTQLQDSGKVVSHAGLAVQGFPNRFDLTVTQPRFADPATGIRWEAPFFQVLSLSYKPWHVIAALPSEQRLTLDGQAMTIRADKLQASIVAEPAPALPLDRLTLIGDGVAVVGDAGWSLRAQALRFATRQAVGENAHELGLSVTDFAPDPALMALFEEALPPLVGLIRLDAVAGFTAPIDRMALQTHPRLASLDITEARVEWGDLRAFATGRVIADAAGFAEGAVTLRLENWRLALDVVQSMGLIAPEDRRLWDQAAGFLALGSSDKEAIDLPLQFKGGRALIGPVPVGVAPRLR
jgi:hypothetical protein